MPIKIILKIKESYFEKNICNWFSISPETKEETKFKEIEKIRASIKSKNIDTIILGDDIDIYVFDNNCDLEIKT